MAFAVYNSNQVACIVGGVPLDSGRGDDEFVAIAQVEDEVALKNGIDGSGTLSVINARAATLSITLMRTSKGNSYLSGLRKSAQLTGQGVAVVPIVVTDIGSSGDIFAGAECAIQKFPDESYAKETNTVTWVFICHNPERFIGGH